MCDGCSKQHRTHLAAQQLHSTPDECWSPLQLRPWEIPHAHLRAPLNNVSIEMSRLSTVCQPVAASARAPECEGRGPLGSQSTVQVMTTESYKKHQWSALLQPICVALCLPTRSCCRHFIRRLAAHPARS